MLCTQIAFPYCVLMGGKREREGKTNDEGEGQEGEGDRREKGLKRGRGQAPISHPELPEIHRWSSFSLSWKFSPRQP